MLDGEIISSDINEAFAAGKFGGIPLLIGSPASSFGPGNQVTFKIIYFCEI